MINEEEILKILLQNKKITVDQLTEILQESDIAKKKAVDIIIEKKIIDQEDLAKIRAGAANLAYENLIEKEIGEGTLNIIPSEVSENYKIVCFGKDGKKIKVGLTDPDNFKAIEAVDFLAKGAGLSVEYYLISDISYRQAFKQYKSFAKELSSALKTRAAEEDGSVTTEEKDDLELADATQSAPVAKIVSVIIRHAVEGGASDIHIEPLAKETRVRYRIDGILHTSLILPRTVHAAVVARIKVMSNLKLDETRVPQDGRIRLAINDKEFDFRVSILPLINTEKVVMRILDTSKKPPTLLDLGYQGEQLKIIETNLKKTEGMLLATGPTGSGKSTTLFSLLTILNQEGINISTLEDPVEYQIKGVNQSQIRPLIGYTFSTGLRSFLRQDPDVIMVGEIRDEETAELSIHAALTGHYVVSTLHTTNAPGAITRLIDMGVEPFLLGSTLHTVIAQRLGRKICNFCKEEIKIPGEYIKEITSEMNQLPEGYIKKIIKDYKPGEFHFYKGKGCPRCGNTGYTGRVAISEVLDVNNKLKELIINGTNNLSVEEIRKTEIFVTMFQDGILKVLQGITTMEEVIRIMRD
jgi:type IV pilus assembly protein PilB